MTIIHKNLQVLYHKDIKTCRFNKLICDIFYYITIICSLIKGRLNNKKIKKRISQVFDLQIAPFESWLTIITLTRNACCHHARIWNKQNTIRATIPNKTTRPWITLPTDLLRIYFNICIIKYFLNVISPDNDMLAKLRWLFVEFPEIDLKALGFPQSWEMEPLWR